MEIEVNLLAIVLATVASMAIGSLWYSKFAFGESWMQMVGLTKETAKEKMLSAIVGMYLLSLLMGYLLSHVTYLSMNTFGYSAQLTGISTACMTWFGFVLPTLAGTGC